jgi:NADH-quinone oxidoreductase subunit E
MSVRRLDPHQPKEFRFTDENLAWAKAQIAKYPEGRQMAAVLPILWRAQEQNNEWLPEPAIRAVADLLGMPYIRVYEIATFYTMFNLSPVGRHHIQLCGTTPCMLRGAEDLKRVCERVIGRQNKVTADGALSWVEVECLGACVNAPMIQVGKDYFEDLTPDIFEDMLQTWRSGGEVQPGPKNPNRHLSAPEGGQTTLLDPEIYKQHTASAQPKEPARAETEKRIQNTAQAAAETAAVKTPEVKSGDTQPVKELKHGALAKPEGDPDNFSRIAGLDADSANLLRDMGYYHFRQIGEWTKEDQEWLELRQPRFKGKTSEWIAQAKALLETQSPGGAAPNAAGTRQGKDKGEG